MDIMHRRDIAKQLHYVLDLHPGPNSRRSKARLIVNIVIDSITKALQRGEKVHIQGFGMFYVRDWGEGHHYNHYFYRDKGNQRHLVTRKAKKRVWFKPYKYLNRITHEKEPEKAKTSKTKETRNEPSAS